MWTNPSAGDIGQMYRFAQVTGQEVACEFHCAIIAADDHGRSGIRRVPLYQARGECHLACFAIQRRAPFLRATVYTVQGQA